MNIITSIQDYLHIKVSIPYEKPAVEAYDIWAASYDAQPGNLMLHLDSIIFSSLIKDIPLKDKSIADIGCGTGRHWQMLYDQSPAELTGYDVSTGMLSQLKKKFPSAITRHVNDNLLSNVATASVDCIISTLTIAHIKNADEAIASWGRILKEGGHLVITDFHPAILAQGGKRTFKHANKNLAVKNYVHDLAEVKKTFMKNGFSLIREEERRIDETVRPFYEAKGAMDVFLKFKGMAVIYGLTLKKQYGFK